MGEETLIRLNKFLSDAGVCSRRQADKLIEEGKVTVNGQTASMGMRVKETWNIIVDGKPALPQDEFILLAFHKPRGVECTANATVENNIVAFLNYPKRIYPIGRLDKDSEGLILMTNQGELSNRILKASNNHEKEYEVTINRPIDPVFLKKMADGVRIRKIEKKNGKEEVVFDTVTRRCTVRKTGDRTFHITITQGLNRQIRRMCEACGAKVVRLKRVRIMNILLGDLKLGEYREIGGKELDTLLSAVGMKRKEVKKNGKS